MSKFLKDFSICVLVLHSGFGKKKKRRSWVPSPAPSPPTHSVVWVNFVWLWYLGFGTVGILSSIPMDVREEGWEMQFPIFIDEYFLCDLYVHNLGLFSTEIFFIFILNITFFCYICFRYFVQRTWLLTLFMCLSLCKSLYLFYNFISI
jgi:hypothetical protein